MIRWSLPVALPSTPALMECGEGVVLLGSCFAERIGQWFVDSLCPTVVNPFGTLYNPASLAALLNLCLLEHENELTHTLQQSVFIGSDGLYRSWLHDTTLTCDTPHEAYVLLSAAVAKLHHGLQQARWLFVTFGTNHAYYYQDQVVANCHRQPQQYFVERSLSLEAIVQQWNTLVTRLLARYPNVRLVFTVSPYRYAKYGLHESALSKATLLLAIDRLQQQYDAISYFPAYEIVIDELRDYRFYTEDLCHPTLQASDYVWRRLTEWCFSPELLAQVHDAEQLQRALRHRVQHTKSQAYRQFLDKLRQQLMAFSTRYPWADLTAQLADISQRTAAFNVLDDE
ncbi:MAG: GSCFA domain-containing protein [Bacteroidales bacterium]|nr:GSCFA domain-containing protein [Bacteroidales bacterium]